ncbi:hypothetical protein QE357_004316 [Siphonobacter sp. BAB-5404]|nr:hypothetical protein [Siphonobacter sp. SORGH_AS_0500]
METREEKYETVQYEWDRLQKLWEMGCLMGLN